MSDPVPTKAEIVIALRALANDMDDIAITMEYVGGFDTEFSNH